MPTGADLATATISGFSSGAGSYFTATFASPVPLTAGTQYALVIRPVANPSPGTYALLRSGTAGAGLDAYAGGSRVSGTSAGTVWTIPLTAGVTTDSGFRTYMDSFLSPGSLVSAAKTGNLAAGFVPGWTTLSWAATTPANTSVQFQAAASDSPHGPFSFVGPDGTASTFFTTSGASLAQFNGLRYLRYRALLATTDTTLGPILNDVTVCMSSTAEAPQSCGP